MMKNINRWIKYLIMASGIVFAAGQSYAAVSIACIGDSLTEGFQLESAEQAYPAQLAKCLGEDYSVRNFGVSGSYVIDDGVLIYRKTEQYQNSLNSNADILVFMFGSNDIRAYDWTGEYFKNQYIELAETYRENGKTPKMFFIIPPESRDAFFGRMQEASGAVFLTAQHFDASVIDSGNLFIGHPEYYQTDLLHLNAEGYKRLAELVSLAIRDPKPYIAAPEETIPEGIQADNEALRHLAEEEKQKRDIENREALEKLNLEKPNWQQEGVVD